MYPTSIGAQHMRTMKRTSALADITDPELLAIPTYEAVPPPEARCFPEYLRLNGYYTSNNSKEDYQFRAPVTVWDESSSKAHWRNRDSGQPFFSVFNIGITHESQTWRRANDPLQVDPAQVSVPPYYPDTPVVRRDVARHYNNIQLMDAQVGQILAELEQDQLLDNTVIFFFSDHGDGLPRAKRWLYDSGLHVPLLVRFPDNKSAGEVSEALISFIDFAPTILSLAQIRIPAHMQGQAFLGPQAERPREYIFAAKDRMDPAQDNARAVRDKRFKYIKNYYPERPFVQFLPYRDRSALMQELHKMHQMDQLEGTAKLWFASTKPAEELYDTLNDPYEVNNLAAEPKWQEKLSELRGQHVKWRERTRDWGTLVETELVKRLWPPGGMQPQTAPVQMVYADTVFTGSQRVLLNCNTPGASIGYKLGSGDRWRVYDQGIILAESDTLFSIAHRIGYKASEPSVRFFKRE